MKIKKTFLISITLLLNLLFVTSHAQIDTSITFTEIMFYPNGSNNEFIEIYNLSDNPINIDSFKIQYSTSSTDIVVGTGMGTIIPAKSFAVILEGDYDFANGLYLNSIPDSILVLTINNNNFGSAGMANTSDREVKLFDKDDSLLFSYTYSANNGRGHSDEKIFTNTNNTLSNWGNSIISNGTPGRRNSITPYNYDASITELKITPEVPIIFSEVDVELLIKNIGMQEIANIDLTVFLDRNNDTIPQQNEIIYSDFFSSIIFQDSIQTNFQFEIIDSGVVNLFALIESDNDENILNDQLNSAITVITEFSDYNDLIINEFMYNPIDGEPEWIELYNKSNGIINLKNWRVGDNSSTSLIIDENYFIPPGTYVVLSDDESIVNYYYSIPNLLITSLPSLNNSEDRIILIDSLSRPIDSLNYTNDWSDGVRGVSLERKVFDQNSNLQDNWSNPLFEIRATPGRINTVTIKNNDISITDFISNQEYGIVGDDIITEIKIKNVGFNNSGISVLNIYNDVNLDSTIQQTELINSSQVQSIQSDDSVIVSFTHNTFVEGENQLIAQVEWNEDEFTLNNINSFSFTGVTINEVRNDLVINEIMYSPVNSEPEWIEVYNRSSKSIDLKEYYVSDYSDTNRFVKQSEIIEPDNYFIFTDDSSFLNTYPNIKNVLVGNLPSLNNSSDDLFILDSLFRVIDSLEYKSSWGGKGGISLERSNVNHSPLDSVNWSSSISPDSSTPGRINSISFKENDIGILRISSNPSLPFFGDNVSISLSIKNHGTSNAQYSIKVYRYQQNFSQYVLVEEKQNMFLSSFDSTNLLSDYKIQNIRNETLLKVETILQNDEYIDNNILEITVTPGFPTNSILINEFMAYPSAGNPEWIELYNNSNDTINIRDWKVSDVLTRPVEKKITENDFHLLPKNYLLISRDSSILNNYNTIPSAIVVVPFASLNNSSDGLAIKDSRGVTIDSLLFDEQWQITKGYSHERVSFNNSNIKSNWGVTRDLQQATPGRINSIAKREHDLKALQIKTIPKHPNYNQEINLEFTLTNIGEQEATQFTIQLFIENNLVEEIGNLTITPKDTVSVVSSNKYSISDSLFMSAKIIFDKDEDTLNNFISNKINAGVSTNSIIISEFMLNPNTAGPEWVELLNNTNENINIKNWMISDIDPVVNKKTITETEYILNSKSYIIIISDTSNIIIPQNVNYQYVKFGSLGNIEDGIAIYDSRGSLIDSVYYNSNWLSYKGRSLERLAYEGSATDSSNWKSSIAENGHTMGASNSISTVLSPEFNSIVFNEIMFEPDNNNSEFIEIYNRSDQPINIGGWRVSVGGINKFEIIPYNSFLNAKDYFIVSSDSGLFKYYNWLNEITNLSVRNNFISLPSSGKMLYLTDLYNNVIDSMYYNVDQHNQIIAITKNKSLEKIDYEIESNQYTNWSTSVAVEGASPGKENSVRLKGNTSNEKISIHPNPFSPDNDGFEDFSKISFNFKEAIANVRIRVYDSKGRKLREIFNQQGLGINSSFIFDGLNEQGRALKIGIYILLIDFQFVNGIRETYKEVIVVARKL